MLKLDFLENKKNFRSEIKIFSQVSQLLSVRHEKQTSKNLVDTTFNPILVKISQFEFLVMTKKNIFVYKLFCH